MLADVSCADAHMTACSHARSVARTACTAWHVAAEARHLRDELSPTVADAMRRLEFERLGSKPSDGANSLRTPSGLLGNSGRGSVLTAMSTGQTQAMAAGGDLQAQPMERADRHLMPQRFRF